MQWVIVVRAGQQGVTRGICGAQRTTFKDQFSLCILASGDWTQVIWLDLTHFGAILPARICLLLNPLTVISNVLMTGPSLEHHGLTSLS